MSNRSRRSTKRDAQSWREFDCPTCSAHNPWDDGFAPGETLFCAYCGAVLKVRAIPDSDPPAYRLEAE